MRRSSVSLFDRDQPVVCEAVDAPSLVQRPDKQGCLGHAGDGQPNHLGPKRLGRYIPIAEASYSRTGFEFNFRFVPDIYEAGFGVVGRAIVLDGWQDGGTEMRLMIDLRARASAAYQTSYHNKLRGRLWRALEETRFDEEHGDGEPMGLSYSNIFPWGEIAEGDERTLLIASPREELLATIAEDLQSNREFNVGEMAFDVDGLTPVDVDVGEPGTRGVVETATGVVVRLYEHHRDEYGIEGEHGDSPTYWRPEFTIEPFRDAITETLQRKHERFAPEYVSGPSEVDGQLFDGYEFLKTYALPTTVTEGVELDLIVSKWRLDYRVRDDTHRKHLNLALDTGIGGRNGLGFGFVNVAERTRPGETELEGEDAFA